MVIEFFNEALPRNHQNIRLSFYNLAVSSFMEAFLK